MNEKTIRIVHARSECGRLFASSPDLLGVYAVGKDPDKLVENLPAAIRARYEIAGPVPDLRIGRAPDQPGFDSCWTVAR